MRIKPKAILDLLKEAFSEWSNDNAARLGAALAYYTIFSIAPLLIIVIFIVSHLWVSQSFDVQENLINQIGSQIGPGSAETIRGMLEHAGSRTSGNVLATTLGVLALLAGATGVFGQLQGALNTIWEVKPKPGRGIKGLVMMRLLSFGMILTIGFLLLVSLIISAVLAALGQYISEVMPGTDLLWQGLNMAISFGVITLLFAMIYRYLPDVKIAWRDVWMGAAFTALLFTIGKLALSLYLGRSSAASAYGAAGSLVVLLIWVYYSAQIFFFGAEFTQVYARRYGSRIRPASYAVYLAEQPGAEETEAAPQRAPAGQNPAPQIRPRQPSALKRFAPLLAAFLAGRFLARRG